MGLLDGLLARVKTILVGTAAIAVPATAGNSLAYNFQSGVSGKYNAQTGSIDLTVVGPLVNVLDVRFAGGADPTATRDSLAAFQAATAAAGPTGIVYVPGGQGRLNQYLMSGEWDVPAGVSVVGDDMTTTELLFYNATNGIVWAGSAYATPAGTIEGLTISGIGTGLCGLKITKAQQPHVERCTIAGWTKQGAYFLDTLVAYAHECYLSSCGGASYGQLEVDGLGWGTGGGSTGFLGVNVWSQSANSGCLCGLRVNRSTQVRFIGGSSASCGTPALVSDITVTDTAGYGSANIIFDGVDMENPQGSAVSFIDFGYGLPDGGTRATCSFPKVINCSFFADASTLPVKGIRFAHTFGSYVDGCGISQGSSSVVAGLWYEGATNQNQYVGVNLPDNGSNPYIAIGGAVVASAHWGSPWAFSTAPIPEQASVSVTTTNNTVTAIYTEPAEAASTTYDYVINVIGQEPSTGDMYRASFTFNYQRISTAGPTLVGSASIVPTNVRSTTAGALWGGVSFAVSGNSLVVSVQGAAATTINWSAQIIRSEAP